MQYWDNIAPTHRTIALKSEKPWNSQLSSNTSKQVRAHVFLPSSTAARYISLWHTTAHYVVKACRIWRWAKTCLRACGASSKPLSLHWCSVELSSDWLFGVAGDRVSAVVVQIEVEGISRETEMASVFEPSSHHHHKPRPHLTGFHLFLDIMVLALATIIHEPSRLPGRFLVPPRTSIYEVFSRSE